MQFLDNWNYALNVHWNTVDFDRGFVGQIGIGSGSYKGAVVDHRCHLAEEKEILMWIKSKYGCKIEHKYGKNQWLFKKI